MDLFPEEGRYAVRGSYRLRNETQQHIDTMWVPMDRHLRGVQLSLSGARLCPGD